jgi:hypothetical protein
VISLTYQRKSDQIECHRHYSPRRLFEGISKSDLTTLIYSLILVRSQIWRVGEYQSGILFRFVLALRWIGWYRLSLLGRKRAKGFGMLHESFWENRLPLDSERGVDYKSWWMGSHGHGHSEANVCYVRRKLWVDGNGFSKDDIQCKFHWSRYIPLIVTGDGVVCLTAGRKRWETRGQCRSCWRWVCGKNYSGVGYEVGYWGKLGVLLKGSLDDHVICIVQDDTPVSRMSFQGRHVEFRRVVVVPRRGLWLGEGQWSDSPPHRISKWAISRCSSIQRAMKPRRRAKAMLGELTLSPFRSFALREIRTAMRRFLTQLRGIVWNW